VVFSADTPLRLVRCRGCGTVYRNPTERGRELKLIYSRSAPLETQRALHASQRDSMRSLARRLSAAMGDSRKRRVLEVGSYVGAFLAAADDVGLRAEGLDINRDTNVFVRSRGCTVHDGELTTHAPPHPYDAIAIWNTFDQLADPRAVIHAAARVVRSRGTLAIRVPNGAFYARWRGSLRSRTRRARRFAAALLAQNNLLGFPYRFGFTPSSLVRLIEEGGFAVRLVFGDVLRPRTNGHGRGRESRSAH
jgi:SAM-dependent methyltransferase